MNRGFFNLGNCSSESVKLRGNSTGRADAACPRRSESVKLRGNSTGRAPTRRSTWRTAAFRIRQAKGELRRRGVPRGVPRCSESVKLRGNSTGRGPPWRCTWRSAAFRIRQAKGELHRTRAAVALHVAFRSVPNPSS